MIPSREQQESLNRQAELVKVMAKLPVPDAIGVACSYLLLASQVHQDILRRVLNEPVVKEGFRGTSLLTILTRVSKE